MKLEIVTRAKAFIDGTSNVLKVVDNFDSWDRHTQIAFINESFFNIINYCYIHVPYYHKLFVDYGLNPKEATTIDYISRIPFLTKDIVRSNYNSLRSDELANLKYQDRRSGGTTGEPIRSLVSKDACAFETFSYFKGLRWMGWSPSMRVVKIFGGSLGVSSSINLRQLVYKHALNTYFIPAFSLDLNTILRYYSSLKKEKKICILGYASAIYNFVNLLKSENLILNNVSLVITTSEQLINDWETGIYDFFQCPIRSYYGCGEVGSLGYQESEGDHSYRIPIEHVYLETVNKKNEIGITQFFNKAQPLIRYCNGDIGVIEGSIVTKRINNLVGRTADFFLRKDGTQVSPIFGTVSIQNTLIPVKKYQYVQYSNRIIEFRYLMEQGDLTDHHRDIIRNIVDSIMGEPSDVAFNKTSDFEIGPAGKYRITVTSNRPFIKQESKFL